MNIAIISAVLSITPKVVEAIRELEALDSTSGKGAAKKEFVLKVVEAAYTATGPAIPFSQLAGAISEVVDAAVAFYNSVGTFIKGAK